MRGSIRQRPCHLSHRPRRLIRYRGSQQPSTGRRWSCWRTCLWPALPRVRSSSAWRGATSAGPASARHRPIHHDRGRRLRAGRPTRRRPHRPAPRVTQWLAPLPVKALHGIDPKHSATLQDDGVRTGGLLPRSPPRPSSACGAARRAVSWPTAPAASPPGGPPHPARGRHCPPALRGPSPGRRRGPRHPPQLGRAAGGCCADAAKPPERCR